MNEKPSLPGQPVEIWIPAKKIQESEGGHNDTDHNTHRVPIGL